MNERTKDCLERVRRQLREANVDAPGMRLCGTPITELPAADLIDLLAYEKLKSERAAVGL